MTKDDAINHVIRLMERQRADNMPIKSNREVANEIVDVLGFPEDEVTPVAEDMDVDAGSASGFGGAVTP